MHAAGAMHACARACVAGRMYVGTKVEVMAAAEELRQCARRILNKTRCACMREVRASPGCAACRNLRCSCADRYIMRQLALRTPLARDAIGWVRLPPANFS